MTETPIACTLSPDQMRDRVAFTDTLVADALLGRLEIEGGMRSRFRDSPDVERRVRELVGAERRCCAFLTLALRREEGELWLDITGAPEAQPVIEQFFRRARPAAGRG